METPYQKLFGSPPNYGKLRIFGCLCFPWLRPYTANKFEERCTLCVFIGYAPTQSAYLCLQTSTGRIYISRHVKFDEQVFPFSHPSSSAEMSPEPTLSPSFVPINTIPVTVPLAQSSPGPMSSDLHQSQHTPVNSTETVSAESSSSTGNDSQSSSSSPSSAHSENRETPNPTEIQAQPNPPRQNPQINTQPTSQINPSSSSLQETVPPQPVTNIHPMKTRRKNQITKPNTKYNLSVALSTHIKPEPRTVNQALNDPNWRRALSDEIDAFARNQTFDLVPRQPEISGFLKTNFSLMVLLTGAKHVS